MTRVRIVFHFSHATVIDNERPPEVTASNVRNFRERNATRRISWYDEKKKLTNIWNQNKSFFWFMVKWLLSVRLYYIRSSTCCMTRNIFMSLHPKQQFSKAGPETPITSGRDKIDFYSRGSLTPRAAMKFRFQSHRHSASAGAPQGLFKFQPKHLYICTKTIKLRNH